MVAPLVINYMTSGGMECLGKLIANKVSDL